MRTADVRMLGRAALAGAATGSRSFTGLAAVTLSAPDAASAQPDRTMRIGWVKVLVTSGALVELVLDKLPAAPDRLAPGGLAPRIVVAAFTGQAMARREWPSRPGDPVPAEPVPAALSQAADGQTARAGTPGPAAAEAAPPGDGAAATAAAVAVGTALAAAWLGSRWRRVAARHFGRGWPGAVIEDAAALSLAWVAARS